MRATDQLIAEHRTIKEMLEVMAIVCDRLESGESVDAEHLNSIVGFIRGFADKCHHAKEEDLFFPAIEKAGIPAYSAIIGVFLLEHKIGREYVKSMADATSSYERGNGGAAKDFTKFARLYVSLLKQHIAKENNILFKMADKHLSAARQMELMEGFEKLEKEEIGSGKHEEFERILERLKDVYLK